MNRIQNYRKNWAIQSYQLKKGNFWIGTGDVSKGPTSSTGFYNGINPPSGGYTIYLNKASGGPSIYTATNDAQLISLTNLIAGTYTFYIKDSNNKDWRINYSTFTYRLDATQQLSKNP